MNKVKVPVAWIVLAIIFAAIVVYFVVKVLLIALSVVFYCLLVLTPLALIIFWKPIWRKITGKKKEEEE